MADDALCLATGRRRVLGVDEVEKARERIDAMEFSGPPQPPESSKNDHRKRENEHRRIDIGDEERF